MIGGRQSDELKQLAKQVKSKVVLTRTLIRLEHKCFTSIATNDEQGYQAIKEKLQQMISRSQSR